MHERLLFLRDDRVEYPAARIVGIAQNGRRSHPHTGLHHHLQNIARALCRHPALVLGKFRQKRDPFLPLPYLTDAGSPQIQITFRRAPGPFRILNVSVRLSEQLLFLKLRILDHSLFLRDLPVKPQPLVRPGNPDLVGGILLGNAKHMCLQILHQFFQLLGLLRNFSVQLYDSRVIIFLRPGSVRSRVPALCLFLLLPRFLLRIELCKLREQIFRIYFIENRTRFHSVPRRHADLLHKQTVQSDHRLRVD